MPEDGAVLHQTVLQKYPLPGPDVLVGEDDVALRVHDPVRNWGLPRVRPVSQQPEHEEAEEEVAVKYSGEDLEIGFNVNYLLDALSAVDGDQVEVGLIDSNSSCLITEPGSKSCKYVVMPMRL